MWWALALQRAQIMLTYFSCSCLCSCWFVLSLYLSADCAPILLIACSLLALSAMFYRIPCQNDKFNFVLLFCWNFRVTESQQQQQQWDKIWNGRKQYDCENVTDLCSRSRYCVVNSSMCTVLLTQNVGRTIKWIVYRSAVEIISSKSCPMIFVLIDICTPNFSRTSWYTLTHIHTQTVELCSRACVFVFVGVLHIKWLRTVFTSLSFAHDTDFNWLNAQQFFFSEIFVSKFPFENILKND